MRGATGFERTVRTRDERYATGGAGSLSPPRVQTMTDDQTMVRTTLTVGEDPFLLAQAQDYDVLQRRIQEAIRAGGGFVEFVAVGNRKVSIYMNGRERIVLTVETVAFDARDTGDIDAPFGGFFDHVGGTADMA